jgi:Flp pilus assembly protein TadD
MHNRFASFQRVLLAVAGAVLLGCNAGTSGGAAATADPEAALMARGVDLLYKSTDPIGAEAVFREVLQRNWTGVLKSAETINDTTSVRIARQRLAAPDTASQDALMVLGIDLLRRQNNPTAAAEQFRKVLQRTPTHYGATYQLAMALEKSGQSSQARPLWQKVLGMATTYKDEATIQTAREHLAK